MIVARCQGTTNSQRIQMQKLSAKPNEVVTDTEDRSKISALDDYGQIRKIIAYLSEDWRVQPSLERIAAEVGMSSTDCQKLFRRWAGISPKEFLQAITIDHARAMLRASASLLDTALETGLSGTGRLHDLFIDHEAMTPGDYKRGGEGLAISYGVHPSPFGMAVAMATNRGLCGLAFADTPDAVNPVKEELMARWPNASYISSPDRTGPIVTQIFSPARWSEEDPVKIILIGTDFEVRVWRTLLDLPMGSATSYAAVADKVCTPAAARAVGRAVGHNPIAFVVPCHRVLRKDGNLGGYHWGLTRKKAIIGWEAAQLKKL